MAKRWKIEEIAYVEKHYSNKAYPLTKMAEHLGRSVSAIKTRAQGMGILRKYIADAFCVDCGSKLNKWYHTKRCITCSNKHRSKEHHHNWKGGISSLTDMIRRALFEVWTYPVMERDNFTCQYCGHYRDNHVHHLMPLKKITEGVLSANPQLSIEDSDDKIKITSLVIAHHTLEGGITVCKSCHISIHYPEKSGELLGSPEKDNQQPSRGNVRKFVPRKVQRLTLEDSQTNKSDTSARHPASVTG